jgi:UDP-N-acetylmuramoylalanine--D-glutamate ligase
MDVKGRKTLVLGAGRSGVASSRFLAERGAIVALHDRKPLDEWQDDAKALRETHNVGLISGDVPSWLLDQIQLVIVSPGVPSGSIPARYVDRKDGEVIGEIELAFRYLRGNIVAITGSNGKTTTTALVGEILKNSGISTLVGGNIGTPMISLVESSSDDGWNVIEVSSFQLETIKTFRPQVGVCLNVTPNHLDRYDSFQDYAAAKHRLFMNQGPEDTAVLNADNEITAQWADGLRSRKILFSIRDELDEGCFLRGDELIFRDGSSERALMPKKEILLPGSHNVENVLAAFSVAIACGVDLEAAADAVRAFRGVEHRLEFVADIGGVRFFNDSKATSVDAAMKAVEALSTEGKNMILILGGRGKNAPYAPLIPLLEQFVSHLVVIGEDAENIERQLAGVCPIFRAATLDEAVKIGYESAKEGDTVLLAPACASFDMFSGFEERGDAFKKAVEGISAAKLDR